MLSRYRWTSNFRFGSVADVTTTHRVGPFRIFRPPGTLAVAPRGFFNFRFGQYRERNCKGYANPGDKDYDAALLEPDRINYATGASRIGRGGCLDEVSELIAVPWLSDQTDGDLGNKPAGPVPFARKSNAISSP